MSFPGGETEVRKQVEKSRINKANVDFMFVNWGHYFGLIYILACVKAEMLKASLGGSFA